MQIIGLLTLARSMEHISYNSLEHETSNNVAVVIWS